MKLFIDYFWYLIKHKWLVFKYCKHYGIVWQGITHDWTKFSPSEFIEYAGYFASGRKTAIEYKWLEHLHKHKHHWQYWILINNEGVQEALHMPKQYVYEMIADWLSVAVIERGHKGAVKWVCEWYDERKDKMTLEVNTRRLLELELGKLWEN